jgi:hypothetical protein
VNIPGVGSVPATPQGSQALYVSGTGSAWVTVYFPRAGVFAIDFRAAAEVGPDKGNLLDFYLGDQRVTPNGGDPTPPPYPWWPGNGNRDSVTYSPYGTVPIRITAPGKYVFKIVGRGSADRTTVIDDVRVESLDAIFAGRIPAGGRSAGETSTADYWGQQAAQAAYAQAYGLNVVAYEGGWSLGGDREAVPLQAWAKYSDTRAIAVMAAAVDGFFRAGGDVYVLGTYDIWHLDDAANANGYPLIKGIDVRLAALPAAPTARLVVRGSTPLALRPTNGLRAISLPVYAAPGDWMSWTVQVPTTANYKVTANTTVNGTAAIDVDGVEVARGPSGSPVAAVVRLTAGVHTIRVQSVGLWFVIQGATIQWVGNPPA